MVVIECLISPGNVRETGFKEKKQVLRTNFGTYEQFNAVHDKGADMGTRGHQPASV